MKYFNNVITQNERLRLMQQDADDTVSKVEPFISLLTIIQDMEDESLIEAIGRYTFEEINDLVSAFNFDHDLSVGSTLTKHFSFVSGQGEVYDYDVAMNVISGGSVHEYSFILKEYSPDRSSFNEDAILVLDCNVNDKTVGAHFSKLTTGDYITKSRAGTQKTTDELLNDAVKVSTANQAVSRASGLMLTGRFDAANVSALLGGMASLDDDELTGMYEALIDASSNDQVDLAMVILGDQFKTFEDSTADEDTITWNTTDYGVSSFAGTVTEFVSTAIGILGLLVATLSQTVGLILLVGSLALPFITKTASSYVNGSSAASISQNATNVNLAQRVWHGVVYADDDRYPNNQAYPNFFKFMERRKFVQFRFMCCNVYAWYNQDSRSVSFEGYASCDLTCVDDNPDFQRLVSPVSISPYMFYSLAETSEDALDMRIADGVESIFQPFTVTSSDDQILFNSVRYSVCCALALIGMSSPPSDWRDFTDNISVNTLIGSMGSAGINDALNSSSWAGLINPLVRYNKLIDENIRNQTNVANAEAFNFLIRLLRFLDFSGDLPTPKTFTIMSMDGTPLYASPFVFTLLNPDARNGCCITPPEYTNNAFANTLAAVASMAGLATIGVLAARYSYRKISTRWTRRRYDRFKIAEAQYLANPTAETYNQYYSRLRQYNRSAVLTGTATLDGATGFASYKTLESSSLMSANTGLKVDDVKENVIAVGRLIKN